MHIAYIAPTDNKARRIRGSVTNNQLRIRLKAYQTVCDKYSKEITAIQKHLPGWVPPFPAL